MQTSNGVQSNGDQKDLWIWSKNNSHKYSVNSAYQSLTSEQAVADKQCYERIWNKLVPLKVAAFGWKVIKQRVATKDNLQRRGMQFEPHQLKCPMCQKEDETVKHLFFHCDFAQTLWSRSCTWWNVQVARAGGPESHLLQHCWLWSGKKVKEVWATIWLTTIWTIWIERNNTIFQRKNTDVEQALDLIKLRSWFWAKASRGDFHALLSEWYLDPLQCAKT